MKFTSKKIIVILVAALAAGVVYWIAVESKKTGKTESSEKAASSYFCPMHPQVTSDKPGDCPICHMRLVPQENSASGGSASQKQRKILYYRNPMDPRITSPVPAKDSMGMDYIPVYEESVGVGDPKEACAVHECAMIKAGEPCPMLVVGQKGESLECPVCQKHIDLEAAAAKDGKILAGYGAILISPQKQQLIGIRTQKAAKQTLSKTIHAYARVAFDPEFYDAQLEYLLKAKKLTTGRYFTDPVADINVQRSRLKLASLGASEAQIRDIEKQRREDPRLIFAEGRNEAWVYGFVHEHDAPFVKVGGVMELTLASRSDAIWRVPILYVDNAVDPVTRTLKVRALVKNEKDELKPNMFLEALIRVDLGEAVTIPADAVSPQGAFSIVFVDKGQGLFEPRQVKLGAKADGTYQVFSGVAEGESVVTSGNFLLDSESRLKALASHG